MVVLSSNVLTFTGAMMKIECRDYVIQRVTDAFCDCEKQLKFVTEIQDTDKHVFVHCCLDCKKFFELGNRYPIYHY